MIAMIPSKVWISKGAEPSLTSKDPRSLSLPVCLRLLLSSRSNCASVLSILCHKYICSFPLGVVMGRLLWRSYNRHMYIVTSFIMHAVHISCLCAFWYIGYHHQSNVHLRSCSLRKGLIVFLRTGLQILSRVHPAWHTFAILWHQYLDIPSPSSWLESLELPSFSTQHVLRPVLVPQSSRNTV